MSNLLHKFVCSSCGGSEIEEVMTDVVQYSIISVIEEDGSIDYKEGGVSTDEGNVDHYCCYNCGLVICYDDDIEVTNNEDLVEWLKNNFSPELKK